MEDVSPAQLESARMSLSRIKELQQQHQGRFPECAKHQVATEFSCLDRIMVALSGKHAPLVRDVATAVLQGISTQEMLWSAIVTLEDRLSEAEKKLKELRVDHEKLLLRNMGSQLSNKLARLCIKPAYSTPYQARHATLQRVMTHKKTDIEYLQRLTDKYPELEAGVGALNTLATTVAHPSCIKDELGNDIPTTSDLLASLVDTHFCGSGDKEPVQQVLACLQSAAKVLGEELFVDTMTS